jgi:hypothetical protein
MKRIAGKRLVSWEKLIFKLFIEVYTQTIIFNSSTSLLEPYFLPVSERLKLKCDDLYTQEQSLKYATRLESSDREDLESSLMKVIKNQFL